MLSLFVRFHVSLNTLGHTNTFQSFVQRIFQSCRYRNGQFPRSQRGELRGLGATSQRRIVVTAILPAARYPLMPIQESGEARSDVRECTPGKHARWPTFGNGSSPLQRKNFAQRAQLRLQKTFVERVLPRRGIRQSVQKRIRLLNHVGQLWESYPEDMCV